jgi:hypothetical protein
MGLQGQVSTFEADGIIQFRQVTERRSMSNRMYPGVSGPRPDKKVERRENDAERLEWWKSLTPAKQLKELDRRLGKDVGAQKQRARLQSLLSKKPAPTVQETPEVPEPKKAMKAKDRRREDRKKKG